MAKQRHQEADPSNNNALIVLVVGVLLVGGLVAWALTRTVEVTPTPSQETPIAEVTAPMAIETAARNTPPIPMTTTLGTTAPSEHSNTEEKQAVPRIASEDLRSKWSRGEVTVIDVRDATSYASGHIPRALHMQFASIEGMIDMIPKGKPIVLYCT